MPPAHFPARPLTPAQCSPEGCACSVRLLGLLSYFSGLPSDYRADLIAASSACDLAGPGVWAAGRQRVGPPRREGQLPEPGISSRAAAGLLRRRRRVSGLPRSWTGKGAGERRVGGGGGLASGSLSSAAAASSPSLPNRKELTYVISCEQLSSAQSVFGVVNKSVTFLTASSIPVKDILWKKRKDKVVEKEENLDESIYPPFRERILLNIVTGDLTIFNLSSSDEDEYEFESTSIKDSIKFFLTVFEPLPSPTLNCTLINETVMVQCGIPEVYSSHRDLITYSWYCPLAGCDNGPGSPILYVKKESDLSQEIQCTISNALLNSTSSLVLRTCVPADHSRHRYVLLAVPLLVIVLIVILLGAFQRWRAE
ncbi:lymphocyte function-associated antigen 3 isoform X2 [Equus asinus]|uniref:CD58 molecule n=1 Tax=Equus asinus TaxID=9793 RepID=A0A9L0JQD7_EQUAS|nr:lymphocyte function-associated antigen 3 isoform X2 [Equus asinus]